MNTSKETEGLKRVVGVSGLTLNILNITIGAGIFALPATVALDLGSFSIYAYLFCGFMMACIMLCYAEIGSRITSSGGSYIYVKETFGEYAGFLVNWLAVFGWSILGSAALMNIIADSLGVLFPAFTKAGVRAIFFAFLIAFLIVINIRGAKNGAQLGKWISLIKIFPLLALVFMGISFIEIENLSSGPTPSIRTFGNTALVLFFAFAGFETVLGSSGEIKNPQRTIPIGILLGGFSILVLYILIQVVTQGIIGGQMEEFKDAPLAAAANVIIGSIGGKILIFTAAISCFGAVSTDVLSTSRVLYAGARDRLFPNFLSRLHPKFATPYFSIIVFSSMIFLFSISGGFEDLALLASAAILIIYLLVVIATIMQKLRNKGEYTGFSIPGGLIFPILGLGTIIWLLTSLSNSEILSTIIFLATVSLIYIAKRRLAKNKR